VELPTLPEWPSRMDADLLDRTGRGATESDPGGDVDAASAPPLPHVVAWNLTRRCNLACAHCYISAGSWHAEAAELPTADCVRIVDEILEVNDAPLLILSGGEPLLRDDLETIAAHAADGGATSTRAARARRSRKSRSTTSTPCEEPTTRRWSSARTGPASRATGSGRSRTPA